MDIAQAWGPHVGGSRLSLTFQNSKLISGDYKFTHSSETGIVDDTLECEVDVDSLTWINKLTKDECRDKIDGPMDKDGVLKMISSDTYIPGGKDCECFMCNCYEIINN